MPCYREKTARGVFFACALHSHPAPKCYKCGKPAKKLCDHRDFEMRREVDDYGRARFSRIASMDTCSMPLCDECALSEGDMDFCQEHGDYYHTVLVTKEANRIYEDMVKKLDLEVKHG